MNRDYYLKAGIFFFAGILLVLFTIILLGRERQIFARQSEFFSYFRDVKGLNAGAPIRLGGISIGRVEKIGFAPNINDQRVYVTLMINNQYLERIRRDAVVTIETHGLLGDRFVSLIPGNSQFTLPEKSMIESQEPADIASVLTKAGIIVEQTTQAAEEVNTLLKQLKTDAIDPFTRSMVNLSEITDEIRGGKGLAHRIIYKESDAEAIIGSLLATSKSLESITSQVGSGKGLLNALINDPEGASTITQLNATLASIEQASNNLNSLANDVKTHTGILHDLIYLTDEESKEDASGGFQLLVKNLSETSENLRQASQALNEGSGTLGALLIDPSLYDSMLNLTGKAERSFLLRKAIQAGMSN